MSKTDTILARLLALHPNKLIDLKLDRIERLLHALGRPQDRLPPVIHVAGTNGKGSTIAHLRAILEAAGNRVHVYNSPHLVRFNERIRLAGKLVSSRRLNQALQTCEEKNAGLPITYFEITTAAAFLLFSEIKADYLLLEVGLGGRFDATNVIDKPLAAVLTPISIDHVEFLGNDLATIAREKAGILKTGAPAIIGQQLDPVRAAIEDEAAKLGIEPIYADQDFLAYEEHGRMIFQDQDGLMDLPLPCLKGAFQIQNAALAIATARKIHPGISPEQIAQGLKTVQWPGRLMPIKTGTLFELLGANQQLWLDGGHNVAGGQVLARALAEMDAQPGGKRPLVMILGAYANKDVAGYLENFTKVAHHIVAVPLEDQRMSWSPQNLVDLARQAGLEASKATDISSALQSASKIANARIIICGSLHLVGDALAQNKTPPI